MFAAHKSTWACCCTTSFRGRTIFFLKLIWLNNYSVRVDEMDCLDEVLLFMFMTIELKNLDIELMEGWVDKVHFKSKMMQKYLLKGTVKFLICTDSVSFHLLNQ